MTDQETVLRRMREANPVPSLDGLRPGDLAAVRAQLDRKRGRVAAAPVADRGRRWRRAALVFAGAFGVTLLAVGTWLLLLRGDEGAPVVPVTTTTTTTHVTTTTEAPTTTQAPTTTTQGATTTLAPGETPAASIEELVTRIFAALTAGDAEALRGFFADGTYQRIYAVQRGAAGHVGTADNDTYQPEGEVWEVLGEVRVAGRVAVAPVRATYSAAAGSEMEGVWVGFDVTVVEEVVDGFLGGTGVVLYTKVDSADYVEADPAEVADLLASQTAAWAAGDVDGVLAGYWEQARYVDGSRGYSRMGLAGFFAGMRLEFIGEPLISGPFFAVATRVTDLESGVSADGFSVYWVNEGVIKLHVLTAGE